MRFTIATIVIGLVLITTTAEAGSLLAEDFESYTPGTWPGTWIPVANVNSDPAQNRIAIDPSDPTNQVLMMHGAVPGCWGALAFTPFDPPDAFRLEFDVYNAGGGFPGCHQYRADVRLKAGAHAVSAPSRPLANFAATGDVLNLYSGPQPGTAEVIGTYVFDQWHHFRIDYVRSGPIADIHYRIDGAYTGTAHLTGIDPAWEDALAYLGVTAAQGTAYFDNIQISSLQAVPLPRALPLGLMGLLFLLGVLRRSRG